MSVALQKLIKILPILYMGLIWFFSSYPSDAIVDTGLSFDDMLKESLHLVEFGILYLLLIFSFSTEGDLSNSKNKLAVLIAVVYAMVDEIHQYFVPGRSATFIDLVKDITGVAIAWYIVRRYGEKGYLRFKKER